MTLSGTVDITQLRTDLDANTSTLATSMAAGSKDHNHVLMLASLAAASPDPVAPRSIAWTQQDDQELRVIGLRVTDGTASRVVTVALTVDNGDTTFLLDQTVSTSITTIIGTADARVDYRTTTGTRLRLLKGVRYRLALQNTTGATTVSGPLLAFVQVRPYRRRA